MKEKNAAGEKNKNQDSQRPEQAYVSGGPGQKAWSWEALEKKAHVQMFER